MVEIGSKKEELPGPPPVAGGEADLMDELDVVDVEIVDVVKPGIPAVKPKQQQDIRAMFGLQPPAAKKQKIDSEKDGKKKIDSEKDGKKEKGKKEKADLGQAKIDATFKAFDWARYDKELGWSCACCIAENITGIPFVRGFHINSD